MMLGRSVTVGLRIGAILLFAIASLLFVVWSNLWKSAGETPESSVIVELLRMGGMLVIIVASLFLVWISRTTRRTPTAHSGPGISTPPRRETEKPRCETTTDPGSLRPSDSPIVSPRKRLRVSAAIARPLARARFTCSICGADAGRIALLPASGGAMLRRRSFTGVLEMRIASSERLHQLRTAIDGGDADALFKIDFELTPFYCPTCRASYCRKHWIWSERFDEDGFSDEIRGICPNRHERMLED
jgi:hypothetical protein